MMLRSKGIPARYISGFSFEPTDNVLQSDGYINTVSIDDSKHTHGLNFILKALAGLHMMLHRAALMKEI